MGRPSKHSPEVRERAVRMAFDHTAEHPSQWAAIRSVGEKLGIRTESLRRWVIQIQICGNHSLRGNTIIFSGVSPSKNADLMLIQNLR